GRPFRASGRTRALLDETPADEVAVEVDGDDELRTQRAADGDGHRVDQAAVDEPSSVLPRWAEDARHGDGRPYGLVDRALPDPHLAPAGEVGGDRSEGDVEC